VSEPLKTNIIVKIKQTKFVNKQYNLQWNEFLNIITAVIRVNKLNINRIYWALLYEPSKHIWPIDLFIIGVVFITGVIISVVAIYK